MTDAFRDLPPKTKGEISEQFIIAHLLRAGWKLAKPLGDNQRVDLLMWNDGPIYKVQCKTAGKLKENCFRFPTCSVRINSSAYVRNDYLGQIDFFAVWQPELEKCYLVPIEECQTTDNKTLRINNFTGKSAESKADNYLV